MKAPNGSVLLLTCLLGNVLAVPTLPVGDLAAKRSTQLSRDTGAGAAPLDLVKKSGEPDVLFGEKFRREEAVEQTIQAAAEGVAAEAAELFPGLDAGDLLLPSHSLLSNGLFHGLGTSGPFSTILKSFVSAIKAFFSQLKAAQTGKSTSSGSPPVSDPPRIPTPSQPGTSPLLEPPIASLIPATSPTSTITPPISSATSPASTTTSPSSTTSLTPTSPTTSLDPTTSPTPTTSLTPITSLLPGTSLIPDSPLISIPPLISVPPLTAVPSPTSALPLTSVPALTSVPVPFPSQSSGAINSLRDGLEGLLKDKGNDVNLIQGLEGLLKGIGNLPKDLGNLLKPLGSKTDQGDSSKGLFKGLGN